MPIAIFFEDTVKAEYLLIAMSTQPQHPQQHLEVAQPTASYGSAAKQEEGRPLPVAALKENTTPVAAQLSRNRQKSVISALTIALLGIVMICGTLYVIKLFTIESAVPAIVSYSAPVDIEEQVKVKKINIATSRNPSAPSSSSAARVIASVSASDISIPIPEFEVANIDFGLGDVGDMGSDWVSGTSGGDASDAGGFGSISGSGLVGHLYDFKQDRKRNANIDYLKGKKVIRFTDNLIEIHKKNFSERSLQPFFKAPQKLTLTHLAISNRSASDGPLYFNADKDVDPKSWIAHYSGKLVAPETGRYRFAGFADDYLSLFFDDKPVLFASWPNIQKLIKGSWEGSHDSEKWASPIGLRKNLIYSDWISLRAGQIIDVDLGIGEYPGGMLGFLLLVEKKGTKYKKDPVTKRPILPLFSTASFTSSQKDKISNSFGDFQFDWGQVPVFTPAK